MSWKKWYEIKRDELCLWDLNDVAFIIKKKKPDAPDGLASSTSPPAAVSNSIYQLGNRRLTPTTSDNEDIYIGSFSSNAPHGSGKYLWSDGCMYKGEWRRGNAFEKGKFSWPSEATYEGELKSGRIEGSGTFTGPDGDTYRGSCVADRKHGYGQR